MRYEIDERGEWAVMENDLRERTTHFALRVIRLYASLPQSAAAQVIGKQMLRSGTSVGANYREAYRARSDAEYIAKMGLCVQELDETTYWFELLLKADIVLPNKLSALQDEADQLIAIFTTVIKKKKHNM
jgi:four helix bundle protein